MTTPHCLFLLRKAVTAVIGGLAVQGKTAGAGRTIGINESNGSWTSATIGRLRYAKEAVNRGEISSITRCIGGKIVLSPIVLYIVLQCPLTAGFGLGSDYLRGPNQVNADRSRVAAPLSFYDF